MGEFDGKVALVTGGASGIGAAVVALLLERGAAVASVDLNAGASPDGSLGVDGDVTDSSSVADAVARAESELGPGDVVCVNRGIEHELFSEGGVTFFEALSPVPLDHVPDRERDLVLAEGGATHVER